MCDHRECYGPAPLPVSPLHFAATQLGSRTIRETDETIYEYQLWPILDALNIHRCGLHAFRHTVASFIVDAGYAPEVAQQQLRHTNARTTLGYIHLRSGITEQAMANVANSLKLDAVGREVKADSQYIQ